MPVRRRRYAVSSEGMSTEFAPAERDPQRIIEEQAVLVAAHTPEAVVNGLPLPVVVINDKRQIVFCNRKFEQFSAEHESLLPLGRRPGEALGCAYAELKPGGCGTTRFCRFCGAARAILRSLDGEHSVQHCRLVRCRKEQNCLDFQVYAQPLKIENEHFVLFSILDISHELRLESIRRKVLRDVRRRAEAINRMYVRVSRDMGNEVKGGIFALGYASRMLMEEIDNQSRLFDAEDGLLGVVEESVDVRDAFADAVQDLRLARRGEAETQMIGPQATKAQISKTQTAENQTTEIQTDTSAGAPPIQLDESCAGQQVRTDRQLLVYVLRQLMENAVEAPGNSGPVKLRCDPGARDLGLRVSNPAVMPEEARMQLFQRGFSTKGEGRGFGLYFARLLVRRYLNGSLELLEHDPVTVFEVRLPRG